MIQSLRGGYGTKNGLKTLFAANALLVQNGEICKNIHPPLDLWIWLALDLNLNSGKRRRIKKIVHEIRVQRDVKEPLQKVMARRE